MLHIYKASAGSGKTYTLTLEYIKLLLGYRDEQGRYRLYRKSDAQHRRILAVTFTNKATEEMKHRIVFQLDILAHDTEKSPYVDGLMQLFGCTDSGYSFGDAVCFVTRFFLFQYQHDRPFLSTSASEFYP